jgi:hypothetical protein
MLLKYMFVGPYLTMLCMIKAYLIPFLVTWFNVLPYC